MNASLKRRDHVVRDRPVHRVLEVEDARVRLAHHEVARHVVAVDEDPGLREIRGDDQGESALERLALRWREGRAQVAADIPVGEELELAPQQRRIVRRQLVGSAGELPFHDRVGRVGKEAICDGPVRGAQRFEVRGGPEIGEQQETPREVLLEHARCIETRVGEQTCDVNERPAVLFLRRSVHGDERGHAVARERHAEIAAEARIGGRGREREVPVGKALGEPALELGESVHGETIRGAGCRCADVRRRRCLAWADMRFYGMLRRTSDPKPFDRENRPQNKSARPYTR